ncbi:cytochrome P450 [Streptomyces coelicoflavus]|uniref:Cytochrome P450 n=1 Tax=Streptomyces coelicoflavus TaxID=285562 RepID=A0A6N9UGR6_9ACTN|nr:cytochrome P450 [Streptomyces coelicoflavus]NEB15876.1 cytochrome P450 [Streptomyces coelicoflavus]
MNHHPNDIEPPCAGALGPHSMRTKFLARTGDPVAKLIAPGFRGDACALYEQMRVQGSVHRSRTGLFAVVSYDGCHQVLQNPRFSTCASLTHPADTCALACSAPARTEGRRSSAKRSDEAYAIAEPLLRPALHQAATRIDTVADDLLRLHAEADSIDLVDDFAFPLVVACLGEVLGIPSADSARFADMCDVIGRSVHGTPSAARTEAVEDAHEDLAALVIRLERERRQSPGGDLISRLTAPRSGNERGNDLTRLIDHVQRRDRHETPSTSPERSGIVPDKPSLEETAEVCRTLIASGLDTAVCLIGNAVAALAARPEQWQTLRTAPNLAAKAVGETLRFDPPRRFILRIASEQAEVGGRPLPPRSGVLVVLAAAHRDGLQFTYPARFDLARSSQPSHLTADGAMRLEISLARLAGEIALWTLASRLPHLRPAGRAVRRPGGAVSGFTRLPFRVSATG